MNDFPPADAADTSSTRVPRPAPDPAPLPISFTAFHDLHAQRYTDYAFAHLGDPAVVCDLVDDVFVALADRWHRVLAQPSPAAYAWALLRRVVEAECLRRAEHLALIEEAAFAYVLIERAKRLLEQVDECMVEDLGIGISVARAIQKLPGRQHDVVVLRFLAGYTPTHIAEVMGIEEGTVRSLVSQARTRLKTRLAPRRTLVRGRTHDEE
ncbi:RNA polymerase sigma factor [Kitasatospora purpeofusca]|uniref:RNA polymerase sigma factor n=1 Tax=Kitasatospora purpeofusca TaxID=67352 RepID=UPI00068E3780|nr:sigma-70 family RNA polymerase sigma factor [Kitasatospora purpeofusca]